MKLYRIQNLRLEYKTPNIEVAFDVEGDGAKLGSAAFSLLDESTKLEIEEAVLSNAQQIARKDNLTNDILATLQTDLEGREVAP